MKTQTIKQNYPVLYQIVKNSLERQRLPHAFLLVGSQNLKEISIWMSAICTLLSIEDEKVDSWTTRYYEYGDEDVIFLDGSKASIKKEEMMDAMNRLNVTSKQVDGVKTLIVHQVEQATLASMNSFLKGLEEPSSTQVHFILTTDNLSQVLDTIVSRCLVIHLETVFEALQPMNPEVKLWVEEFIMNLKQSIDGAIVELQLLNISDRNLLEEFFLQVYQVAQKLALEKTSYQKLASISIEMASKINRSVNTQLLVDEYGYRLKEELQ